MSKRPVLLIFDMMDTLIDDPFYRAIQTLMNRRERHLWQSLRNRQSFLDFESGRTGESHFFRKFFIDDDTFVRGAGVSSLPSPQRLKKEMMKRVDWLPGVQRLLSQIKQPMALASNYSVWYHDVFAKRPDLPGFFQYLFFSCEVGHRKPDALFFDTVMSAVGTLLPAVDIVYFDDREENLIVPQQYGWQVVHVQKEKAAQMIEEELQRLNLL